jgi:hypothetical protein
MNARGTLALFLLAGLPQQPGAQVAKQIDHAMFTGGPELSGLVAILRDKFKLPVVFHGPAQTPPFPGTCLSFGNMCLEVVPLRPDPGDPPRDAQLGSFALQATNFATTVDALRSGQIDHFPPDSQPRWTTIGVRGLGGIFFIEYRHNMDEHRAGFRRELESLSGGPLGITRMIELSKSVDDAAVVPAAWIRLFGEPASADLKLWHVGDGPAIRLVGRDDPRAGRIVAQVRSLEAAATALRRLNVPFALADGQIRIEPRALFGLRLVLTQ